jgi:large repetitive protein
MASLDQGMSAVPLSKPSTGVRSACHEAFRTLHGRKIAVVGALAAVVVAGATAGTVLSVRAGDRALHDPSDVRVTSEHPSSDTRIEVAWTPRKNVAGYSILWSHDPGLPDQTVDVPPDTGEASLAASPGRWWFNMRTKGANGDWTSTVHVGPIDVLELPETDLLAHPKRLSNDSTPTFEFGAEGASSFECGLDGRSLQECTPGMTLAGLDEGRHRFEVRAVDQFGNRDPEGARWAWQLDTRDPQTQILSAAYDERVATFTFSSNEKRSRFECSLDRSAFSVCTSPQRYERLAEGDHSFLVRARDHAGNPDATPAQRTWVADFSTPNTNIVSGPAGEVSSSIAMFTFSSSEAESTFECSLDGAPFSTCSSPITYSGLARGFHTFDVRAEDKSGNVDETPATRTWRVRRLNPPSDTTPPNTRITSAPPTSTTIHVATFRFTSSEVGSTFQCSLDGGAWASCSSPKTYNVALGSHTFRVRARDAAGNVDPTPAAWDWAVH